jgi:hypothetical protein
MFRLISRPDPAPLEYEVADSETLAYGTCVKFDDAKLVAAGGTDAVAGITAQSASGGEMCKIILVDPEQIWEADLVGDGSPDADFVVGLNIANLDTDGIGIDETVDTSDNNTGPCSIIKIDSGAKKCWVKFKLRQLT